MIVLRGAHLLEQSVKQASNAGLEPGSHAPEGDYHDTRENSVFHGTDAALIADKRFEKIAHFEIFLFARGRCELDATTNKSSTTDTADDNWNAIPRKERGFGRYSP
jgi:hypothetical protein